MPNATEARADTLCRLYGEVCTQTQAGKILSRSLTTVRAMMEDGRLRSACAGKMVDVRSIAAYIEAPAQANERARVVRLRHKDGIKCRFSV